MHDFQSTQIISFLLQGNEFHFLDVYLVLSIIHGGAGYPFMSRCLFDQIATGSHDVKSIPILMIPDAVLRFVVEKV